MRHLLSIFLGLAVVVCTSTLRAESGAITGEAAERYREGKKLYSEGKFDDAADALREAFRETNHPVLMYNIALAEWRAGDYDQAFEASHRATKLGLTRPLHSKNEALARGLEVRRRATDVAGSISVRPPKPNGGGPAPVTSNLRPTTWLGVGLSTLGAASFGGALWVDRRLAKKERRYRRAARNNEVKTYRRLNRELERQQRLGVGFLGAGILATGAGAYFLLRDLVFDAPSDARLEIAPRVRGAGVDLRLRLP